MLPSLSRYSAGLNGFTAEGDHLPVAVEDTAAVAEARAAFMAYMIELMAEQREGEETNVQVEKLEDEGAINLGQVGEGSFIFFIHTPENAAEINAYYNCCI